jgi:hypothetical protein
VTAQAILRILPPTAARRAKSCYVARLTDRRRASCLTRRRKIRIRGWHISMIFREPMVIAVAAAIGDQMVRALFLHRVSHREAWRARRTTAPGRLPRRARVPDISFQLSGGLPARDGALPAVAADRRNEGLDGVTIRLNIAPVKELRPSSNGGCAVMRTISASWPTRPSTSSCCGPRDGARHGAAAQASSIRPCALLRALPRR